jgi:hypothetical protein
MQWLWNSGKRLVEAFVDIPREIARRTLRGLINDYLDPYLKHTLDLEVWLWVVPFARVTPQRRMWKPSSPAA